MTKSIATATEARVWLIAHPKTLARLSPAAQRTVVRDAQGNLPKGRLHGEAITLHNRSNRKAEYVLGSTGEANKAAVKAAQAARKAAQRKASRKGATVGARGPLPKAYAGTPKG